MRRRWLLIVLAVACLYVLCSVPAAAQSMSAGAMLVKGGATHISVSASWQLVEFDVRDAPLRVYGDLMAVQDGFGGGLSVPVLDVLSAVGILPAVKLGPTVASLAPYLRMGCAVTRSGGAYDGGPYAMLVLGQVTW